MATPSASFGVTYKVKDSFFDRKAIQDELGKTYARALSKAGAFIRTTARRSMRRRKRASEPGTPPSVHSRNAVANLRNILFAYDRRRQSVVIGPVLLNQKQSLNGQLLAGTVPQLHEFGGTAGIREKLEADKNGDVVWVPRGRGRLRRGQPTRVRQAQYPARPFMWPALEKEAPGFPELFAGRAVA